MFLLLSRKALVVENSPRALLMGTVVSARRLVPVCDGSPRGWGRKTRLR